MSSPCRAGCLRRARLLIPLTALAAAPDRMPLLPRYDGIHLDGDAAGYFQVVSGLFASLQDRLLGARRGGTRSCARGCRRRRGVGVAAWTASARPTRSRCRSLRGSHDSRSLHSCARRRRRRLAPHLGARSLPSPRARAQRRPTGPSWRSLSASSRTALRPSRRRTSASGRAGTARSVCSGWPVCDVAAVGWPRGGEPGLGERPVGRGHRAPPLHRAARRRCSSSWR